jgi:uncharacterized delta-60 repeat protein
MGSQDQIEEIQAVAVQPDGKILVAASILSVTSRLGVVRYNPDGSLDTTFDGDGKVTTPIGPGRDLPRAMTLQGAKIVVAGFCDVSGDSSVGEDFAVARYNANGSLDTTFDGDGRVTTPVGEPDTGEQVEAVLAQPDGKIVVGGEAEATGFDRGFALVRYNTNGSLDTTFSGYGVQTTDFGSSDRANAVVVGPDSRITVAGSFRNGDFNDDFALARYIGDATAPTVESVVPAENATGIAPGANVSAFFSEEMMATSTNANTVKLFKLGTTTAIGATVSYNATTRRATLNPNANLQLGTKYKAVVTAGTKDLAGNQLDQNSSVTGNQQKVWFFTVRN